MVQLYTANFSEAINASTVSTSTFQLRNPANTLITATVSTSGNQITLTPSAALANSTVYTVTITGGASGVKDLAGNALAVNYSWTFTTVAAGGGGSVTIFSPTSTPQTPLASDGQGITLGVKFRSSQNGFITGVRYYKGAGTTGTHTGQLWSRTGTLLAATTFTGETASGWQQVLFATPIAITANTTYVATYFSPSGQYAASKPYFTQAVVNGVLTALADGTDGPNGLYRYGSSVGFPSTGFQSSNYWVDIVFNTSGGNVAPSVTTQPASQTRCAGTNASFTSAASGTPAPTVQWQESTNGTTWTNITGATSPTLSFVTTTADNNKQYRAAWTNSVGTVNSNAATLTVNPIPVLSSNLTATAASGTAFTYTATSSTTGATFAWSRAAVTGISNASANGTGNINETLVNTTASPVNVTYVYTLTANSCTNTQNVVVTVNTSVVSPIVTTQPLSQTQCAGANASFTSAASGTPTPTVQWQGSPNGTTWTNITGATSATLSFTTSTADNNKQYRAVWTNSGGPVNSNPAILTVNPIPVLSSNLTATAASGTAFSYTPTSTTTGTTFTWTRAVVTGISNTAGNGTGNINETLVNITASAVNVTYVYTLTANSCTNTQNVVVTVNTGVVSPTITTQPLSQTKCAGTNASFISAASGTPTPTVQWQESPNGTTWINITGATSATLSFTTSMADNNKQYRAVWTNSGGPVNSNPAILTVNPIPVLSSNLTGTAASGTAFAYTPTSTITGTTFTWARAVVTGISNTAGNGTGSISEILINTTTLPVNVTYVYTLSANSCTNAQDVIVTVNAEDVIVSPTVTTQPVSQTKCAGENVSFTSAASGAPAPTVQWQGSTDGTSWSNIVAATSATLSFVTAIADNNKQYRAEWTNSGSTVNLILLY